MTQVRAMVLLFGAVLCSMQTFGQSLAVDPGCGDNANRLKEAQRLFDKAQFEEAVAKLNGAVGACPQFVEAYVLLGRCNLELRQIWEAERAYRRALELKPEDAEAKEKLAAISVYSRVVTAAAALKNKRWREARSIIKNVTEGRPEGLGPIATAISWRYDRPGIAAYADLMYAYRILGRYDCMEQVEEAWRRARPDCEVTILIHKLAALVEAADPTVAKTRTEILARLDAGELFFPTMRFDGQASELMSACGWSYSSPQLLKRVSPRYTAQAIAAKAQGSVLLEATIERDGRAADIRVVRSLEPSLDQSSISTIEREWRFAPARLAGRPIRVRAMIDVSYRLK